MVFRPSSQHNSWQLMGAVTAAAPEMMQCARKYCKNPAACFCHLVKWADILSVQCHDLAVREGRSIVKTHKLTMYTSHWWSSNTAHQPLRTKEQFWVPGRGTCANSCRKWEATWPQATRIHKDLGGLDMFFFLLFLTWLCSHPSAEEPWATTKRLCVVWSTSCQCQR